MSPLKKFWKNNSKHKKLCEDWNAVGSQLSLDPDGSCRRFLLKYVGAAPAERACSAPAMAAAVAQAVSYAKGSGKKLRRVAVTVSPKGIAVEDAATSERILDVSIYRISYCSADANHSHVFAFIAQGAGDSLECHAFLCPKTKVARSVSLSAAQSFNTAFQAWQGNREKRTTSEKSVKNMKRCHDGFLSPNPIQNDLLIDLCSTDGSTTSPWVSFDEGGSCDLWDDGLAARLLNSDRVLS